MPQAQQEAVATAKAFRIHTPKIRTELELVEADVWLDQILVQNEEIDAELSPWIPDTGTSHSKETKYHRTIDLYWHMKTLLGKVMTERNTTYSEILLQMEYLQLQTRAMDQKSTLLAKRAVDLDLNEPREDNQQVPMETMNSPPAYYKNA